MENNKCVLIYGFTKEEKMVLGDLFKNKEIMPWNEIEESMCDMTISDIISGLKLGVFNIKNLPKEKVILFNNLSDLELDSCIKSLRGKFTPHPILAVVTPTSIDWTFKNLLEHLIEEREWFKKRGV